MKIIIGVTGASGAIYARQVIECLKKTNHEVSLLSSRNGRRVFREETGLELSEMGYPHYEPTNFDVPFASGSAKYDVMTIVPCSMGSLARIAHGISDDILTRTADVFLKEKQKLILVPRDTPLSLIHIENLRLLSLAGVTLIPAIPSFYSGPQTIEQVAATVTSRILDHMGIENDMMRRWKE